MNLTDVTAKYILCQASCKFFGLRETVEKETSSAGMRADDARKAFENLFKK